jgi:hypothetical protein
MSEKGQQRRCLLKKSGYEVVDRRMSCVYGTMALTSGGNLKVDKRMTRPMFGLEARKRREEERGHLQRFTGLSTRPVRMYLCSSDNKYTKVNLRK